MSYRTERERFIARMTQEGLPYHLIEQLLRVASGMQRRAELACSSEAADRDRVPCPKSLKTIWPCLCDDGYGVNGHQSVPRIQVQDWKAEQRLREVLPAGWQITTQGDPRGYVLRVIPVSYLEQIPKNEAHHVDAIGVPARPSNLRF